MILRRCSKWKKASLMNNGLIKNLTGKYARQDMNKPKNKNQLIPGLKFIMSFLTLELNIILKIMKKLTCPDKRFAHYVKTMPNELTSNHVEEYLTYLAVNANVTASTQKSEQASPCHLGNPT